MKVPDGALYAARDHHGAGFTADLVLRHDLLVEGSAMILAFLERANGVSKNHPFRGDKPQ
jgi:hypothetical protein